MRRRALLVAAVAVAVLAVGTAGAALTLNGGQASTPQPTDSHAQGQNHHAASTQNIAVTGDGEASAAPDKAVIRVAAVAEGDDPAAVRDDLAQGAADLRAALEDAGIDDEQISTADYTIRETRPYPRHEEERDEPDYQGVHAFEVELDDTERVGAVVDAAAGSGAQVQQVEFTLAEDTREQLRDEALQNAMDDADHQAGTLADASDLEVTGVRNIDATDRRYSPVSYSGDAAVAEASGPSPGTSIDAGDVSVQVTVQVVYEAAG